MCVKMLVISIFPVCPLLGFAGHGIFPFNADLYFNAGTTESEIIYTNTFIRQVIQLH